MRAKFIIESVQGTESSQVLKMRAVTHKPFDEDGNSEDNSFAKWTPSGSLEMTITNPAVLSQLVPGDAYYLDFTKAD